MMEQARLLAQVQSHGLKIVMAKLMMEKHIQEIR